MAKKREKSQKKNAAKVAVPPPPAAEPHLFTSRARTANHTPEERAKLKAEFLSKFKTVGTVYITLEQLSQPVAYTTWAQWVQEDTEFALAYKQADERVTQLLETSALSRSVNGVVRPIISHGKPVVDAEGKPVVVREFSDDLTKFLLKSRNREKYGDQVRHEFNVRIAQQLSGEFVKVIRKIEPQLCANCRTHLKLPEKVAQELQAASAKLKNV